MSICACACARGLAVICTPHAVLYHRELASRGPDATAAQHGRVARERAYLLERWGAAIETEAFLSPNLTVVEEELALAGSAALTQPSPASGERALLTRHREPPLGGVAIQGRTHRAAPLDCFVAKRRLAMTVASMSVGRRPVEPTHRRPGFRIVLCRQAFFV